MRILVQFSLYRIFDGVQTMGTRIGYRIEARARMKGRYGTGWHMTSLIKTIGGEFSDRQRNPNHNYAYTRLQQILSQDSSRTSVHFVPCTGLWCKRARNFKSYDYLTLFQYPCLYYNKRKSITLFNHFRFFDSSMFLTNPVFSLL